MTDHPVVEQQLVVHRFLPVDGPQAEAAGEELRELWSACRRSFGMTAPIPGTHLPAHLPEALAAGRGGPEEAALAAQELPDSGYQAILRRCHDVLGLSVALAPRVVDADGRAVVDPAAGEPALWWADLDRRWRLATAGRSGAALGEAVLCVAVVAGVVPVDGAGIERLGRQLARFLPPEQEDDGWPSRGVPVGDGLVVWETTARQDGRVRRRFLVVGGERDQGPLSAWLWSDGGVRLPPLARYLLHASKIHYQLRVWRRDRDPQGRAGGAAATAGELRRMLGAAETTVGAAPVGPPARADLAAVRSEELAAVSTSTALRQMRRTVEVATANMTRVPGLGAARADGPGPFADDLALAEWFVEQLADDDAYLTVDAERARRVGEIGLALQAAAGPPTPPAVVAPVSPAVATEEAGSGAYGRHADAGREAAPATRGGPAIRPEVSRRVFVVHGRDNQVRDRMFDFLRALDLRPMEWEPLVTATGSTAPYLRDVVGWGVTHAQAAVVLLTPEDQVSLHPDLRLPADTSVEAQPGLQARPNVLLELGMALATYPDRTLVIQVGETRPVADLGGLNFIRLTDSPDCQRKIASRLRQAGCAVDDTGSDWLAPGRFAGLEAYHRHARS
ncbi:CATRA conflict system CASPASE/TPR repeat-associated protein [Micromonospora sp. WMMD712]|uniref:CATRA conflict system CASPASE/TPR repeat-associated protein n=1 Tax=Micromonospora sp. WMMD712 TaxID=3016096 RepID=UPI00249ADB57|nr:CATRA conflict system CASPASE/TPR repeat-associated protein [Micromonospora sp. WMMD712]WFE60843.1 nucleotide-binding protein [Micromonospora sp. WMMD712]